MTSVKPRDNGTTRVTAAQREIHPYNENRLYNEKHPYNEKRRHNENGAQPLISAIGLYKDNIMIRRKSIFTNFFSIPIDIRPQNNYLYTIGQ